MKRRDFFKITAGSLVIATTKGVLVDMSPELPDLPDPDYDRIVTSAFPLSESKENLYTIGAEDFQLFNLHFPHSGGEAKLPGFTHIKGIMAEAVDQVGCKVTVMPSGIPYPQGAPEMWFQTPVDGMTFQMEKLWLECQDGVIKADGEAALTVHCWRPKIA